MTVAITSFPFVDSAGTAQSNPVRANASGNYSSIVSTDSSSTHYSVGKQDFAPVATPTAFAILAGSATKTIRIKKILVTGAATAAGSMQIQVDKCSDAGTLGSAVLTAVTPIAPHDSNNAAATATLKTVGTAIYTTVPNSVGIIGNGRLQLACIGSATTSGAVQPFVIDYTSRSDQAIVLRGTLQSVTLSGNGSALPSGAKVDFFFEFEESPLDAG